MILFSPYSPNFLVFHYILVRGCLTLLDSPIDRDFAAIRLQKPTRRDTMKRVRRRRRNITTKGLDDMKKWLALALAFALTVSLAACGKQDTSEPADDETNAAATTPDDTATPDDAATTPDDTAAPDDAATTPDDTAAPDAAATTPDDTAAPDAAATTPDDTAAPEVPDVVGLANPFKDYATYAEAETAAGFKFGVPEEIGGYDKVAYRVAENSALFEVIYSNDADASLTARKAPGDWNISGDYSQYTQDVAQSLQGVNVTCLGDGDSLFLAMWTVDDYSYSLGASSTMDRLDFLGIVETIISLNT